MVATIRNREWDQVVRFGDRRFGAGHHLDEHDSENANEPDSGDDHPVDNRERHQSVETKQLPAWLLEDSDDDTDGPAPAVPGSNTGKRKQKASTPSGRLSRAAQKKQKRQAQKKAQP